MIHRRQSVKRLNLAVISPWQTMLFSVHSTDHKLSFGSIHNSERFDLVRDHSCSGLALHSFNVGPLIMLCFCGELRAPPPYCWLLLLLPPCPVLLSQCESQETGRAWTGEGAGTRDGWTAMFQENTKLKIKRYCPSYEFVIWTTAKPSIPKGIHPAFTSTVETPPAEPTSKCVKEETLKADCVLIKFIIGWELILTVISYSPKESWITHLL